MKNRASALVCLGLFISLVSYGLGQTPGTLKWSVTTRGVISSSPAISPDGTVYVGSGTGDYRLHAINPDGIEKWSFLTYGDVDSSPAIGPDGTIYFGSYDDYIRAISPDGIEKWRFYVSHYVQSSPALGSDGTIYVGSGRPQTLYAINPDGTEKWRFLTGGEISYSSPVVSVDDIIYVGSSDNCLYAINPDGSQKWKYQLGGSINSPAIGSDGTIYIGCSDGILLALDPNGNPKWTFTAGAGLSSPVIGTLETIFVSSANGVFYAINNDGSLKWIFVTGTSFSPSAAISRDGTIYVGSANFLYAINQNGSPIWTFFAIGQLGSSAPAIGSDGTVYIGSSDGRLYAVNSAGGGLADTSWPMFHHDNEHTGRARLIGEWDYPVFPYDPGSYSGRSFFFDANHLGEDESLPEGTPIHAIGPGKIVLFRSAKAYGELVVVVEHDLGKNYQFTNAYGQLVSTRYIMSIYGHLRNTPNRTGVPAILPVGRLVNKDTIVGYVNNSSYPDGTGKDPNGDGLEHLHLGIRLSDMLTAIKRDPRAWFRGYEGDTTFGEDFGAASVIINILRNSR